MLVLNIIIQDIFSKFFTFNNSIIFGFYIARISIYINLFIIFI